MYTANNTNFIDFGVNAGDAQLELILLGNSNGGSPPINLPIPIQFFGRTQHTLFVSQLCILSLTCRNHSWWWVLLIYTGGYEQQCSIWFCSSWCRRLWSNHYWIASFNGFGSQENANGIISFRRPFTNFTPLRFPLNNSIPLIAPFWNFVNNRIFGNIFYRQTSNVTLLQRARDQLRELFPSSGNFTPTTLFIATWDRVAPYQGRSEVSACTTILLLA